MNNKKTITILSDAIVYIVLCIIIIALISLCAWKINYNSAVLKEEKTIFAVQNRLQDYFLNQLTEYKKVKFGEKSPFKNLPNRDELVNLITFLELIDQKTGNLSTISVKEPDFKDGYYSLPGVFYTIRLTGSLTAFNKYISYLETLPYYYVIKEASWQDSNSGGKKVDRDTIKLANQGVIQLLVFVKEKLST